jgi:hypothetical protein
MRWEYVKNIPCPKCKAEHKLYMQKIMVRDKDNEKCSVCREEIYSWNEAKIYKTELVQK